MALKSSSVGKDVKKKALKPKVGKTEKSSSKAPGKKQSKGRQKAASTIRALKQELARRVAELAIINSIQQGLAAELEFQAIVDLVGDKLREVFNTPDLGIQWYDEKTNILRFLYVYEHDKRLTPPPQEPRKGGIFEEQAKTRQPVIFNNPSDYGTLNTTILPGTDLGKSYVAVPIISSDRVIGTIDIEDFERENAFGESELRLLTTIAASLGTALENARLFDETQHLLKETEQRAAELAIINSVQHGLASNLDMQAIYDLVGDKVREIFKADTTYIGIYYPDKEVMISQYYVERGQIGSHLHLNFEPFPMGKGLYTHVIRSRQPLLLGTVAEQKRHNAIEIPSPDSEEDLNETYLGVPIMLGEDVKGVVSVQSYQQHAYTDGDVRLLQTLANSMSVALENARLFDETQRLLKETEQRNAELAIINSVQHGLASKLEMQAIYELVGDKIQEIFNAQSVLIVTFDHATEWTSVPYNFEMGHRYRTDPYPFTGLHRELIRSGRTVLINENAEQRIKELGMVQLSGTDFSKSLLFVPLNSGRIVNGAISLQNIEKEHAFSEADVRLLETLANSMSVALENARLFDETQRLLKETEQRNAELALINGVQQGLASKLEFQSIIDLIGNKVTEIFNAQATLVSLYNPAMNEIHHRYLIERGERIHFDKPLPIDKFRQRVVETRQPWLINHDYQKITIEIGEEPVLEGEEPKSLLFVPMIVGNQVTGIISLQNLDMENAFNDSDVRLLSTIANSMSVALENARLFEETQRLLKETEERAAELAAISTVTQALVAETKLEAMIQLIGSQTRDTFQADIAYVALLDPQMNVIRFPYQHGESFTTLKLGEGLTSQIIRTGEPLFINKDIDELHKEIGVPRVGRDALSYLGVPIKSGRETIGVLSVQSVTEEGVFDNDDLRLLTTIAA
ncbi:MAG: GAF domain-containing protein, partial [Anaerolineales bacterium]